MPMNPRDIAIVDLGDNDHQRVCRAIEALGHRASPMSRPSEIAEAPIAILSHPAPLPEVLRLLQSGGIAEALEARAHADLPTLALGSAYHALCEGWSDGKASGPGLGLLPGIVRPLPDQEVKGAPLLVPHLGYNTVNPLKGAKLIPEVTLFYFAHTHVVDLGGRWDEVLAEVQHALLFPALIGRGLLFGAQFQPEISGAAGLNFLERFCALRSL